jgi:hypothetical protein
VFLVDEPTNALDLSHQLDVGPGADLRRTPALRLAAFVDGRRRAALRVALDELRSGRGDCPNQRVLAPVPAHFRPSVARSAFRRLPCTPRHRPPAGP